MASAGGCSYHSACRSAAPVKFFWSTFFGRTSQKDIVERERAGATKDKGEQPREIEKISLISRLTKMRACSIYGQQFG